MDTRISVVFASLCSDLSQDLERYETDDWQRLHGYTFYLTNIDMVSFGAVPEEAEAREKLVFALDALLEPLEEKRTEFPEDLQGKLLYLSSHPISFGGEGDVVFLGRFLIGNLFQQLSVCFGGEVQPFVHIRPPVSGAEDGLLPPPFGDVGVMAREEDGGHSPVVPYLRPGVLGIFQQAVPVALIGEALRV